MVKRRASKPTAERILDIAEEVFAARGDAAASLVEISERVDIRAPSLYSHYRSKEALYLAVMERLLERFMPLTGELQTGAMTRGRELEWLRRYVAHHFESPNLARLLQHAALDGGPRTAEIAARLLGPMFRRDPGKMKTADLGVLEERLLQGWAEVALKCLSDALADGDPILAVIRGSAINHDGRTSGIGRNSFDTRNSPRAELLIDRDGVLPHGNSLPLSSLRGIVVTLSHNG